MTTRTIDPADLAQAVRGGDRSAIGRALTLVESRAAKHEAAASDLQRLLLPHAGQATRVGLSGPPGVGKSTFIEALGLHLIEQGHRVAVLAVDPSSTLTGGSILGDKARMERLALAPEAFVRPSPSAATLGGVARRTREAMLVLEAAGHDVVLVETVGVGQSETAVDEMVDTFCVLMLPGSGDELQGIKKGIVELADLLVINKADGDNRARAEAAKSDLDSALHYLRPKREVWQPKTVLASGREGLGVAETWAAIRDHRATLKRTGALATLRAEQRRGWLWSELRDSLERAFITHAEVAPQLDAVEAQVVAGALPVHEAAERLLRAFR
ncbi:MAG: methylmalonyl Co-A mutase-associated GTPase MeaB [Planctomycetota bacterium]